VDQAGTLVKAWLDLFSPSLWSRWLAPVNFVQPIAPVTSWFSPTIDIDYRGDTGIERDVVTSVAGYGSQLGTLMDAVAELGAQHDGPAMNRLRTVKKQVDDVKKLHTELDVDAARRALSSLGTSNPQALKQVLAEFSGRSR
jgi:hypothetical protein